MYINSEHKALFIDFISLSASTAITVRNVRSDVNHLFKWLEAFRYVILRSEVLSSYESYLISDGVKDVTRSRRMQTVRRFISWLDAHFPIIDSQLTPQSQRQGEQDVGVSNRAYKGTMRRDRRNILVFLSICAVISLMIFLIPFIASSILVSQTSTSPKQPQFQSHLLSFTMKFDGNFDMSQLINTEVLFKIYGGSSPNTVIGQFRCTPNINMIDQRLSTLKITIGSGCGTISKDIQTVISSEKTLLADIYIDEEKLTSSKIVIGGQNGTETISDYQNSMKVDDLDISKIKSSLPDPVYTTNDIGQYTASMSATLHEVLPSNLFVGNDQFRNGDVIAIYENSLVRAILSTKVLGIQSPDGILTKGIIDVNLLEDGSTIEPGDSISTSSEPGLAKKANSSFDTTIGVALEKYVQGDGKLRIFLGL